MQHSAWVEEHHVVHYMQVQSSETPEAMYLTMTPDTRSCPEHRSLKVRNKA